MIKVSVTEYSDRWEVTISFHRAVSITQSFGTKAAAISWVSRQLRQAGMAA